MADPLTTNRTLAVPTRGSDVGNWDVPLNNNANALDTLGLRVLRVADGEDLEGLARAYEEACRPCGKPTLIVCRTIIGQRQDAARRVGREDLSRVPMAARAPGTPEPLQGSRARSLGPQLPRVCGKANVSTLLPLPPRLI